MERLFFVFFALGAGGISAHFFDHPIVSTILLGVSGIAMEWGRREAKKRGWLPPDEGPPWMSVHVTINDTDTDFDYRVPFLPKRDDFLVIPFGNTTRVARVRSTLVQGHLPREDMPGFIATILVEHPDQQPASPPVSSPEPTGAPTEASSSQGEWKASDECSAKRIFPCTHPDASVCQRVGLGSECSCTACHPKQPLNS